MAKVLVSVSHYDTLGKEAWDLIESNGYGIAFDPARSFPSYSTEEIAAMPDREEIVAALIGMDDFRDEEKYKLLPNLKAVAKFGVGVDNIDGELAKRYGVKALNAPGQNSNAVAELTVGFMIDLLRRIVPLDDDMRKGRWPRFMGNEIKGKTVGLLGFGAIAKLVAKKLKAFDAEVIAYDLYPNDAAAKELGVRMTTLDEVIEKSDIVSIHIPATKDTYHLFDAARIATMKDGAYIVNAARGALVDLDDLADALMSGKLRGAALDAFEVEPLPVDSKILKCDNIILTPHTGAETYESFYNVSMTTAKDILRVLAGEEPAHCVNP